LPHGAALVAALSMAIASARAADGMKYPDWVAQWKNASGGHFNPAMTAATAPTTRAWSKPAP
jgi:hypothetical protein